MDTDSPIGVVLEPVSSDLVEATCGNRSDIAPGGFVRVTSPDGEQMLALVTRVRSAGGQFTRETAGYHLKHLGDIRAHVDRSHLLMELRFIATIEGRAVVSRKARPLRAGSEVRTLDPKALGGYLGLMRDGGIDLGAHASHADVEIRFDPEDLLRGHVAILGQTGTGKTNVLRLVRAGIRDGLRRRASYVIFDFHDEFVPTGDREYELEPPFAFAPRDLHIELLEELLPGLSVAQLDMLAVALDRAPPSVGDLRQALEGIEGSVATRRVLQRRLSSLDRQGAFGSEEDIGSRVAKLAAEPGRGTIVRFGAVQSELAYAFIATIVRRVMQSRMRGASVPVVFLVDEAHRVMSRVVAPSATRGFRLVAQEGRKFGVTMVLATQRPALVESTILSQCGTVVAMRMTSPEDARAVAQVMNDVSPSDLGALGIGQGVVSRAWRPDPLWVSFRQHLEATTPAAKTQPKIPKSQQMLFDPSE